MLSVNTRCAFLNFHLKQSNQSHPLRPHKQELTRLNKILKMVGDNYKQSVKDSNDSVKLNANATQSKNAIHKRKEITVARKGTPYNAGQAIRMKCIDLTQNRMVFGGLCCNKKIFLDE